MKKTNREPWLWLMVVVVLSATVGWSALKKSKAEAEAGYAAADVEKTASYAQTIQKFRASTDSVSNHELELTRVAQLIEHAADQARISRQALDRVWPRQARRLDDGPYQLKSTQIVVREITLPQAVTFLHHLAAGPQDLRVEGLRLSAPRTAVADNPIISVAAPEFWTLETTISQLLYNPAPASSVARRD